MNGYLYTSGAFTLTSQRMPSPAQRREQAERDFEHWFTSAGQFFITFEDHLARAWFNKAAFELHQAAERFFGALCSNTTRRRGVHEIRPD